MNDESKANISNENESKTDTMKVEGKVTELGKTGKENVKVSGGERRPLRPITEGTNRKN